jgi:small conductance mechanosensitive channel
MESVDLSPWISTAIVLGVSLVAYLILFRIGSGFVERVSQRSEGSAARVATLWVMVRRVIQVVIIVVALLLVFDIWGFSMAPFIAVGTVIAAAIGFGAQGMVRDVLTGFFILAEDQYHIGDSVTIAGISGTVEDIQFRVTVLRDMEGTEHFVSNGLITVASNSTSRYARPVIDVRIGYDGDVDRALEVVLDELNQLASDPAWRDRIIADPEMLGVQELAASGVLVRARLSTPTDDRWSVRREALRRVKNRLDREGIPIAKTES